MSQERDDKEELNTSVMKLKNPKSVDTRQHESTGHLKTYRFEGRKSHDIGGTEASERSCRGNSVELRKRKDAAFLKCTENNL